MDNAKKQLIVDRIVTNITYHRIQGEIYKLVPASKEHRALADMFYTDLLEENKFKNLMTREQLKSYLNRKGIWTDKDEEGLKNLNKYLDDVKVSLYDALYNKAQQVGIRSKIASINKVLEKSIVRKFNLDHVTFESYLENSRFEFLTAIRIQDSSNNSVYTTHNYSQKDPTILYRFTNDRYKNPLSIADFKEMARTDPFRSMWVIGKEGMFGICSTDMSDNQRSLILYSRMYDSVYENPERPSDDVIEDDDMLDGWLIKQRRDSEKERNKKEVDSLLGKKGVKNTEGGEMFVMANSEEESRKILGLNDMNSAMKVRSRAQAVRAHGKLEEQDLPDVKLDLRTQAMRQVAESRGK